MVDATFIARLRGMVAEPTVAVFDDAYLSDIIELYSLPDPDGLAPSEAGWVETYDLHAAAADVWQEKAGKLAVNFDFAADGGNFSRSQAHKQMMEQSRYHMSRRAPRTVLSTVEVITEDDEDDDL